MIILYIFIVDCFIFVLYMLYQLCNMILYLKILDKLEMMSL
jgi:hypothetical protein